MLVDPPVSTAGGVAVFQCPWCAVQHSKSAALRTRMARQRRQQASLQNSGLPRMGSATHAHPLSTLVTIE
eukprot:5378305-Pyramimonas_sp.AAC.2